ncbi:unnamed protein product [Pedinophyceae sp. YPF-701]|nr:unnamed protein product [Pedinophyceae sp. YPF-701]
MSRSLLVLAVAAIALSACQLAAARGLKQSSAVSGTGLLTITELKLLEDPSDPFPFEGAEVRVSCYSDTAAQQAVLQADLEEVNEGNKLYTGEWPLGAWNATVGSTLFCRVDEVDAFKDDYLGSTLLRLSDFTAENDGTVVYFLHRRTDATDATGAFPRTGAFKATCPGCVALEVPESPDWTSELVAWPSAVRGECFNSGPKALDLLRDGLCCQLLEGATAEMLGDGECDSGLNTGFCRADLGDCTESGEPPALSIPADVANA